MSWRVVRGDCIEAMAAMEPESVHAVVCDPPYGLEFMGKEWDRLGDIGKTSHGGAKKVPGPHGGVAFSGSSNVKCQRCGKWKWDHEGRKCECGPDAVWPNVQAHQGRAMQDWHEAWAREALRVLKPGGHLLAFGGTRTVHRLTSGIEDAGFEIRDTLAWMYGSGFPKSLDVSKAIDKAAGAEREVIGASPFAGRKVNGTWTGGTYGDEPSHGDGPSVTAPATPEAQAWEGWGTALKPAYEPVVVARKLLVGTVAANVVAHGTGALNIDACRIGTTVETWPASRSFASGISSGYTDGVEKGPTQATGGAPAGRWPANVILSHAEGCNGECVPGCPVAVLDAQTGELHSQDPATRAAKTQHAWMPGDQAEPRAMYGDSGGASRFFYVAKASSAERNAGLDGFEVSGVGPALSRGLRNTVARCPDHDASLPSGSNFYACGCAQVYDNADEDRRAAERPRANVHPTVKPIEVMRWLVRLVTPPGGTVLDPFCGSGTTGIACVLEGFDFVGVEREPEYTDIAEARIRWWEQHPEGLPLEAALAADGARRKVADTGQVSMFDVLSGEEVA